jgi:hypothetical protein
MTTEDRAYEAAARVLLRGATGLTGFDTLPENLRQEIVDSAKEVVGAFLTAMGQEVQ